MSVDDVFLMLDAKTYKADYVSPNVEKLLGITVEQIQKDISVLGKLHSEDCEDPKKNYLKEIQVNEQQEWDFEYVHQKTGEQRWFHIIAMGSEVNGKKKYILVMSDRTVDKKMNQALYEAVRAAETANRAKSTFLSNMSHDIRTPMNAIIGFSDLLEKHLQDEKKASVYLKKLQSSGNLLMTIINQVLEIARIESGTATLRLEAEDIEALFYSLYTIFEHAADGQMCVDMLSHAEDGYYDLIPMDIQMPILNGYETTKKIRQMEDRKKAEIPILAMTANAFSEDRQAALEADMNDHVAKPIDMNVLLQVMMKYLSN